MPFLPPSSHGRAYHSRHKPPAQHFRQDAPSVSSRDYPADSGLDQTFLRRVVSSLACGIFFTPPGGILAGPRIAPGFIVTPKGQAIIVPEGAVGPVAPRSPGVMFVEGSGGRGMNARVTGVRVMDATSKQGPRAIYMNRSGQTVDPQTGAHIPPDHPNAHYYLEPWE